MGDGIAYELTRFRTRDGGETTVYLVRHPAARTRVSVVHSRSRPRLDHWCAAAGRPEATVVGFFLRDPYRPAREVRVGGEPLAHEPVAGAWAVRRACLHADGEVRLAPRDDLPAEPAATSCRRGRCSCTRAAR